MLVRRLLAALNSMFVVLIMTFLVRSASSAILIMNTIISGGDPDTSIKHRIIWGIILTALIGTLLLAAGESSPMAALRNAMIIGAFPFTFVMGLMSIALNKARYI